MPLPRHGQFRLRAYALLQCLMIHQRLVEERFVTCQVDGNGTMHTRRRKLPTESHRVTFETAIQEHIFIKSAKGGKATCSFGTWNKRSGSRLW
jgi:hypothetical protein